MKDFFWSFFGQSGVMVLKAAFQIYFLTVLPLEYFASYFQASSAAAILCIISSIGIPAFYARNRLKGTDLFIFNYYLNIVAFFNLLMTILAFCAYFIIIDDLISVKKLIFFTSLFLILLSGTNQMLKAYYFKRHDHKTVGVISFFAYFFGGIISIFFGFFLNKDLMLPLYIILPVFIETALLKLGVCVKILPPSLKITKKTRKFLKYDVYRNLLASSFNSLLIITFSFIFQERDIAILGLCATWVNRSILLINGVLKQVFYPIFVKENIGKISSESSVHINLSMLNIGISSISLITIVLFYHLSLWNSYEYSSVYMFLIGSILINCTTPITDAMKARGYINVLFWTTFIISLFYYLLIIINIDEITLSELINIYIFSSIFSLLVISLTCYKLLEFVPTKVILLNSILVISMFISTFSQNSNIIYGSTVIILSIIIYQIYSLKIRA